MSKCAGVIGVLLGHKYMPRYSYGAPNVGRVSGTDAEGACKFAKISRPATYHGDVCERCGSFVNREGM